MLVIVKESLGAVWEGESYSPVPGVETELPDELAENLISAGLAEAVQATEEKPAKKDK